MTIARTYFTADWHLGHEKVIEFSSRKFKDAAQMDFMLVKRFNERVKPQDLTYFLGDMSFHHPKVGVELLQQLQGRKILIQGNHDKYSMTQYRSAGFEAVQFEAKIKIQNQTFRLSHYPYWPKDLTGLFDYDLRYPERRPDEHSHEWLLHGHVHTQWKQQARQINVGVDVWHYRPVSDSEIISLIAKPA